MINPYSKPALFNHSKGIALLNFNTSINSQAAGFVLI